MIVSLMKPAPPHLSLRCLKSSSSSSSLPRASRRRRAEEVERPTGDSSLWRLRDTEELPERPGDAFRLGSTLACR
jgi:hypothetical protein